MSSITQDHLDNLDRLIAYHEEAVAALRQARAVIAGSAGDLPSGIKLLTGPATKHPQAEKKGGRRKTLQRKAKARNVRSTSDESGDSEVLELEGKTIAITPAQGRMVEILSGNEGYVTTAALAKAAGLPELTGRAAIWELRAKIVKACKTVRLNSYKAKGWRRESDEVAEGGA